MRDAIAALLGLEPSAVNVKASSGNLDGAEGAGRSISALVDRVGGGRPMSLQTARHALGRDAPVRPAP